jgi:hypothetical protein
VTIARMLPRAVFGVVFAKRNLGYGVHSILALARKAGWNIPIYLGAVVGHRYRHKDINT